MNEAAVGEMGVAGRDRSASLATSENSRLLSTCGSTAAMSYQRFYIGNMARNQLIFNRGRAQIEAGLE